MSGQSRSLVQVAEEELMLSAALAAQRGEIPTWKVLAPRTVARILDALADEHVTFTPEALRFLAVETRQIT